MLLSGCKMLHRARNMKKEKSSGKTKILSYWESRLSVAPKQERLTYWKTRQLNKYMKELKLLVQKREGFWKTKSIDGVRIIQLVCNVRKGGRDKQSFELRGNIPSLIQNIWYGTLKGCMHESYCDLFWELFEFCT